MAKRWQGKTYCRRKRKSEEKKEKIFSKARLYSLQGGEDKRRPKIARCNVRGGVTPVGKGIQRIKLECSLGYKLTIRGRNLFEKKSENLEGGVALPDKIFVTGTVRMRLEAQKSSGGY